MIYLQMQLKHIEKANADNRPIAREGNGRGNQRWHPRIKLTNLIHLKA